MVKYQRTHQRVHIIFISFSYHFHIIFTFFSLETVFKSYCFQLFSCRCKVKTERKVCGFDETDKKTFACRRGLKLDALRLRKFLLSREATNIPILLMWKCYSFCVVLSVTSSMDGSSVKIGQKYFHIYVDNCYLAFLYLTTGESQSYPSRVKALLDLQYNHKVSRST